MRNPLRRLCAGKTGCQAEQSYSEVDEVEMRVQIQLDGPEVAQTGEAWDAHQRINRSKNQTNPPHPIRVIPKPGPKSNGAADQVKYVMVGRECQVEHFVA